jgi:hypothetical protein
MRIRRRLLPVIATAVAGVTAAALLYAGSASAELTPGGASGSTVPDGLIAPAVSPADGVHTDYFSDRAWKNVRAKTGVGYNIYNDNFGAGTCLRNDGNVGFTIAASSVEDGYGAFPNISNGWEWGLSPLHDPTFPVQYRDDGSPRADVKTHLINSGIWNAAFDMWFSTYKQENGQDNAAEVMIWLDCNRNCIGQDSPIVTVDEVKFHKDTWIADHNGVRWRYTAYVAVSHRNYFTNLWLNPFFKNAGVKPTWYLTSIDFGFELVHGGKGLSVTSYSLLDVK